MAEKEYIERKKLKQAFSTDTQNIRSWDVDLFDLLMIVIDEAPAADVTPVRHGRWVSEYDCGYITPHCSECGETALTKEETSYDYVYSSYCPHCGAKMDKTE